MGSSSSTTSISEKRFLFLSDNGGSYQSYHFEAPGSNVDFGMGDNQIGAELSGHSLNSYTRYSAALLTSSDGDPGSENFSSYDANLNFSQAFDGGKMGVERIGAFAYLGNRPTTYQTVDGEEVPGTGTNRKMFYRAGLAGDFFLHKLEFLPLFMHANDNAYLASDTPNNTPLLSGARDASWNGGFLETHYYINQQLVLLQRVEAVRMHQQAFSDTPKHTRQRRRVHVRHALVSVHVQSRRPRSARRILTRENGWSGAAADGFTNHEHLDQQPAPRVRL